MSPPAGPGLTLAGLLAWYPAALADQSRALAVAAERLDNAVTRLGDALALLPSVWTGVAADAVRITLAAERDAVANHHEYIFRLQRTYDAAHLEVSAKHADLRDEVAAAEAAGFAVDAAAPARGPITVRGPSGGTRDTEDAGANLPAGGSGGPAGSRGAAGSGGPPGPTGAGHEAPAAAGMAAGFAETIAAAAGALLDADARHAGIIAGIVEEVEGRTAPAANPGAIDTALDERAVADTRYPRVPGIGDTGNGLLRDALGIVPVAGTVLDVHEGLLEVEENRAAPGEVVLHSLGAKAVDHAGGALGGAAGATLGAAGLERYGRWGGGYATSEGIGGPAERAVDATILPAARWAATGLGSDVFGPSDSDLTARALRDSVRFGG